jgi:hypothetical protein
MRNRRPEGFFLNLGSGGSSSNIVLFDLSVFLSFFLKRQSVVPEISVCFYCIFSWFGRRYTSCIQPSFWGGLE